MRMLKIEIKFSDFQSVELSPQGGALIVVRCFLKY